MKKQKQAVCPGCSHHCTADAIRCKRGRAYFSRISETIPETRFAEPAEFHRKHKHKWEKNVAAGGIMWNLLFISRKIKKALRSGETAEKQLLDALNDQEQTQLLEILHKLNGYLKKNSQNDDSKTHRKCI